MLFIVPTAAQLDDLRDLVNRGLDDMAEQKKNGNLLVDGYTEEEIAAFQSRANDQQGVVGLLERHARAQQACEKAKNDSAGYSAIIGRGVLNAHASLTQGQEIDAQATDMEEEMLIDVVADLMSYARQQGINFDAIADLASLHLHNEQTA